MTMLSRRRLYRLLDREWYVEVHFAYFVWDFGRQGVLTTLDLPSICVRLMNHMRVYFEETLMYLLVILLWCMETFELATISSLHSTVTLVLGKKAQFEYCPPWIQ